MRLHDGTWAFLDEHLDRLFEAAKAIDLTMVLDREGVADAMIETHRANGMHTGVHARLKVTRG